VEEASAYTIRSQRHYRFVDRLQFAEAVNSGAHSCLCNPTRLFSRDIDRDDANPPYAAAGLPGLTCVIYTLRLPEGH
jgi:hypothetical protein